VITYEIKVKNKNKIKTKAIHQYKIIGSKLAISLQRGPVYPKFRVEGVVPHQPFFFAEN